MAEAEDVIIDAAQHATALAVDYWKRQTHRTTPYEHTLAAHKQRLEILLRSLFNRRLAVLAAPPPAKPTVLTRLFTRQPKRLFPTQPLPGQDGHRIFLPPDLSRLIEEPSRTYRLMAIQQAQRCLRRSLQPALSGTAGDIPKLPADPLQRVLFNLSEAANADRALARCWPGLRDDLDSARHNALKRRPATAKLDGPEQTVERLFQALLAAAPDALPAPFLLCASPLQSLQWAHDRALTLRCAGQRFSNIELDEWLGLALEPEPGIAAEPAGADRQDEAIRPRQQRMRRRPQVREKAEDEDDPSDGFWMVQPSAPMEHVEDPMGMQRPVDQEENADAGGLADSLSELEKTGVVSTPEPAREILTAESAPPRALRADSTPLSGAQGVVYPEWDYRLAAYHARGSIVKLCEPALGDSEWVKAVLSKHRRQQVEVRRRFEAMRTRRQVRRHQIDGHELDMAEYVAAYADRHAGLPLSDRLFQAEQNLRRDCAVMLLIDVSGSTDAWISDQQRIIDIAKESLLLVTTALDALGDPYGIQAFSGEGPQQVCVTELKALNAAAGNQLYRRIAALEPDRFTRAGAALRHATATLAKSNAQRRLLVLLSDGKPNDVDQYESRYGIEDTRQAVREAVIQGIHPFCITVDREAPDYMPYVFGPARFALLPQVHKLPLILLDLLRHFVRS